eukprot:5103458-Amphidinium_carterae.1
MATTLGVFTDLRLCMLCCFWAYAVLSGSDGLSAASTFSTDEVDVTQGVQLLTSLTDRQHHPCSVSCITVTRHQRAALPPTCSCRRVDGQWPFMALL